jgi:hypothetical protein
VHRAALALAVAGRLAEQFGVHLPEVPALGDEMAVAAMCARDLVLIGEVRHHAGGNGFLAHVEMECARDLALLHQLARLFLEDADADHAPVEIVQNLLVDRAVAAHHGCRPPCTREHPARAR